ncbi:eukaryotic translation initiation factor 3 subunit F-1 [Episyrphus balteatus]|uniref:eukaryotic translation initiation factor 3 subunit F-1 n=1 Tax=Episyrphus balteatus TaxID=286459 RepID=UPI002486A1E4|nr:eukaryotic translation initiation factor 3 subunit F-1 [Episyrphus balteatus]
MSALNLTVHVHPVVLFQVVDAYERRNADSHRVIGTLLGSVDKGVVEVTNCFCVPHKEHDDQVEAELSYAMDLYDLNRKVNSNENVVGWWATGNDVTNHSSVIHEYYARECNNPVHLTVDTSLTGGRMGLKAYVCIQLGVPGGKSGCMFTPINVEVQCYEPEVFGLKLLQKTISVSSPNRPKTVSPMLDLAQISEASTKLQGLLDLILKYVEDVIARKQLPDNAVGRSLLDLIHSVPNMSHEQFTQMFNANIRDLLMVVTLSQLIKTQLQLNEKLTFLPTN